jgi:hypothetical protein
MMTSEPRRTSISLSADQLASLDLLIERKQAGVAEIATDVANVLGNVAANATVAAVAAGAVGATPGAIVTATIGAVAAGTAVITQAFGPLAAMDESALREHFNSVAHEMPLEGLLELRRMAVTEKADG